MGILSFLKKKEPLSFKKRCEIFWQAFIEKRDALSACISSPDSIHGVEIVNEMLERSQLKMAFMMGFNGEKYEFFFSPEGNKNVQFLTRCLIDMCPDIPGWLFYPAKQPSDIEKLTGMKVQVSEQVSASPETLFILPVLNEDSKKFDIKVFNEAFKILPEKDCVFITFLLLDEALGEYGTELFVGGLETVKEPLEGSIDLLTFRNRVEGYKLEIEFDAETTPDQLYSIYQVRPPEKEEYALREDVFLVSTSNVETFHNYRQKNVLADYGASYIFIVLDLSQFDMDNYLEQRDEISDKIDLEMQNSNDGFVVGYATGKVNCYIDLIIFDGENSIQALKNALGKSLPGMHGSIHYIEKEKQDVSISF